MRIAIVSKSDSSGGGASRVAETLTNLLNVAGHRALHFSALRGKGFSDVHRSLYGAELSRRATELGRKAFRKLGLAEGLPIELPAMLIGGIRADFDVVHFHDLSSAISPLTVDWFAARMPTFWTFHDSSPFTGGCIITAGCERFKTSCGSDGGCPQLNGWPLLTRFDHTGLIQGVKASIHRKGRIHTLAPSAWMANEALSSGKVPVRPTVVSNGVDIGIFAPADDQKALREKLGLPHNRPIILLSAGSLSYPMKGARHAIDALKMLAGLSPFVLVVGEVGSDFAAAMGTLAYKATGYVSDSVQLARWYSAADIALNCSLSENQPLVILETLACGVPTVAFAIGGIPEIIVHERTGMLLPALDLPGVVAALRRILEPGIVPKMRQACRLRAEERYAADAFVRRHIELYRTAVDAKHARPRPEQRNASFSGRLSA